VAETAGATLKSVGLLFPVTLNVRVCPASSAGPALSPVAQTATVCAPASSRMVSFGPTVKPGASLTPVIVTVKVCGADVSTPPLAVPPLSCSVRVIVAVPTAPGAGV
jgi:hypothetical protein